MRCDGSPDPTNQGEINTYINLKLENKDRDDAESVLKDSQLDLAVSRGGFCVGFVCKTAICRFITSSTRPFVVKSLPNFAVLHRVTSDVSFTCW